MRLSDIKPTLKEAQASTMDFSEIDIWDHAGVGEVDITVEYEYQPASYSDHPYGEGYAREHHEAEVNLISVKTTSVVDLMDDDGQVVATLPIGTDLMDQPFWSKSSDDWMSDEIRQKIE